MNKKPLFTSAALICLSLASIESQASSWMNSAERAAVGNPYSVTCSPGQTAMALQAFSLHNDAPVPNPTGIGDTDIDMFANFPPGTEFILPLDCDEDHVGFIVSEETKAFIAPGIVEWCLPIHADMVAAIDNLPGFSLTAVDPEGICAEFAGNLLDFMANTVSLASDIGAKRVTNVNPNWTLRFFDLILGQSTIYTFADGTSLTVPAVGFGVVNEPTSGTYYLSNSMSVPANPFISLVLPGFSCTPESGISVAGTSYVTRSGSSSSLNGKLSQKLSLIDCGIDGFDIDFQIEVLSNFNGSN